jgi:rhodanese-related sulfurtransferase
MKKLGFVLVAVMFLSFAATSGCGGDDNKDDKTTEDITPTEDISGEEDVAETPEDNTGGDASEFDILLTWLEGDNGDYINASAPKVVGAADVMAEGMDAWVILDTRSQDKYGPDENGDWKKEPNGIADYEDGHIAGATLVEWNAMHTYAAANLSMDDKILVACHTGHLAGHAVATLNLLGYDAYALKFGMSAWHTDFDVWSGKTASTYADQFVSDATAKPEAGDYPTLDTGKATGEEILMARMDAIFAESPRFIEIPDVMAAPEDYFIVNYWPEAEYTEVGHIPGSYQYTPLASLHSSADLATLPIDKTIVIYCYSGQHGSQVALWLTLLGYDARDLKFGTNGMIYDNMTKKQWSGADTGPAGYDYVTE